MLSPEETEEVKKKIVAEFGEELVTEIDEYFIKLHDERIICGDNMEFLKKVHESRKDSGNAPEVMAALLYGMKLGELAAMHAIKHAAMQANPLPPGKPLPIGHAS